MSNVKVTKMSVAKELFVQIQNGEIAVEAGQSARSVFMQKLLTMVDTTAASANMYFQNIHNAFVKGESLYKYNSQPKTLEDGTPECFEIEFEDGTTATISADDHLFVDGKLVKIEDLKSGDVVDTSSSKRC